MLIPHELAEDVGVVIACNVLQTSPPTLRGANGTSQKRNVLP
jgi:hypothetical protein